MSIRAVREIAPLDILRFFAAGIVVLYHFLFLSWAEPVSDDGIGALTGGKTTFPNAMAWASVGWVGVPVFFVISGFVILMSAQNKSAFAFSMGRLRRILPGLWFFSLLSALVLMLNGIMPLNTLFIRLVRSLILFPIGPWVDGAVWTLVAEALFYAIMFLLIVTKKLDRITDFCGVVTAFNIVFWAIVLSCASGQLGPSALAYSAVASSYKLRVSLLTTNSYFIVGISLFNIFRRSFVRRSVIIYGINVLIGFIDTYYSALSSLGVARFHQSPFAAPVVWCAVILFVSACVLGRLGRSRRVLRIAASMGLVTYPLYLTNQIVGGAMLGRLFRSGMDTRLAVALAAVGCLIVAGGFAFWLERPLQARIGRILTRATERWCACLPKSSTPLREDARP